MSEEPIVISEQPMGDLITLPNGTLQNVPYTGMTAAKAAALVKKQIG
jgi:hypothetical protein